MDPLNSTALGLMPLALALDEGARALGRFLANCRPAAHRPAAPLRLVTAAPARADQGAAPDDGLRVLREAGLAWADEHARRSA